MILAKIQVCTTENGPKVTSSCCTERYHIDQFHVSPKTIGIVRNGSIVHTDFPVRSLICCPEGSTKSDENDGGRDSESSKVHVPRASTYG